MLKRKLNCLIVLLFVALPFTTFAVDDEKEPKEVDPGVKVLMYIPDRVADLFDIINLGIAVGPSIGAEIAITKYSLNCRTSPMKSAFVGTQESAPPFQAKHQR